MTIDSNNIDKISQNFSIFEYKLDTDITFRIIDHVLSNKYLLNKGSDEYKTGYNLLYIKSIRIFHIYCCIKMATYEANLLIDLDYIDDSFNSFFPNSTIIVKSKKLQNSYLDSESNIKLMIRHFINLVYRFHYSVFNKKHNLSSVVKTWCDVDMRIHESQIDKNTMIFIFPFVANFRRAINHIMFVRKLKGYKYSLIGIKYNLFDLFKILFSTDVIRDVFMIHYEMKAYILHHEDYNKFNKIYTSDEFLPAIFLTNNLLLKKKHVIVNTAHGLGLYSPFISYSKFHTINDCQVNFYKRLSQDVWYISLNSDDSVKTCKIHKNIVYIHQNFSDHTDKKYEANYQNEIIKNLNNNFGKSYNLFIKFHPNTKKVDKHYLLKNNLNFKTLGNIKEVKAETTFFSVFSTAFYDFRDYGNFIFVSENNVLIESVFGANSCSVSINFLKQFH